MVYCVAFVCNSIVVVVKTFHFSVFRRCVYLPIGTNDVTTIDKP